MENKDNTPNAYGNYPHNDQIKKFPVSNYDYGKGRKKVNNYGDRLINNNWYTTMRIFLIFLAGFLVVLVYLMYNGYLADDIELQCPEISIPECPSCPSCPLCENTCNVECGDFPSELKVNIDGNETN